MNFAVAFRSDDNKIVCIVKSAAAFQRDYMVNLKFFFATQMLPPLAQHKEQGPD